MPPFKSLIASFALVAPVVSAASFDCAKAAKPMEKMICSDPALSKLDGDLGAAYARAIARVGSKSLVREWQRSWLRSPELTLCKTAACVRPLYVERIALLDSAMPSPWNGRYERFFDNRPDRHSADLVLVALKSGSFSVQGDTVWMGPNAANGQVNVGEFVGTASFTGAALIYENADCNVHMVRRNGGLKVEDSNMCGGHNATFTGSYRRRP